ncbi:PREDICTED: E3 ubiquitin-protein ligase UBR2-like isoform X1 [Priapulus caudatus]|uniref:E3 ubiquitin-protein ligase n=1 Tax=Priapulus caudatus TaxID=37621 RepID=A0ABM1DY35_PRICU|nr:PREDICTED: E3 ubiquitin-protein ligase UBR2-like isoform X1 [Priapulus caudatus]
MLIQDYNLLARILAEFLKQCAHYKNMDSKFAFQRNQNYVEFKRAQYMLYDVKYLLTCKPESWPDGLPENFLNGFAVLLDLLSCMQGMDSVTRQVGQHIEYEPEWETAFNLHIKISMFLPLLLEWCATNKQVLVQAYRNALQMLWSIQGRFQVVTRDVDEWAATCINYDPATLPVSIHLPVSRIVAGLHLLLGRFGLTYDSPEFTMEEKPAPRELMEYPLRCQVMVAQSHAGMWRRNGYSLLHQIYLYHSVRCRGEMLDKDIVMLQVSASLLPPNNFLVTLLDRFHLLYWIRDAYDTRQLSSQEETLRQTVALVEEFLRLLIIVLSERFVPGIGKVTAADCLMREIIHQLCIGPMAHSELTKALPENQNRETGLELVVAQVADFKKPRETVRGTYELKPDCYKHYNPFFYHYTRSDLSKSEETQRKRPKASPSEEGCPPPALVSFTEEFSHLAELLDCEVMLRVMRVVLERTGLTHSRSYSEPQLQMVLHLIGIALHEEARQVEELRGGSLHFVLRATDVGIFARLEVLVANDHAKAHKDLLTWVLKLYKKVKKLKSHAVPELIVTEPSAESVARESERERVDQQRRSDLATARRNRILTQMSQMQKTFISENRQLFDETHTELTPCPSQADIRRDASSSSSSKQPFTDLRDSDHSMEEEENPVALGAARTAADDNDVGQEMCILCQETTEIRLDGPAMVLAAFVQRSTVMSKSRQKLPEDVEDTDVLFVSSDLFSGTHTATCGHIMHADCWQKFFESVLAKERRRPIRLRHHLSFDIDKNEFLCPLCENLSNTVLPLLPSLPSLAASRSQQVELPLADWLDGLEKTVTSSKSVRQNAETAACTSEEELTLLVPESLVAICRLLKENVAANFQQLFNYVCDISSTPSGELCESVVDMIYTFSQSAYTIGLDALPHRENPRMPVMTWNSCAFTIHAIEWYLRDEGKPLFGTFSSRNLDCLNALVRSAAVVSYVCSVEVLKSHCVHLLSSLIGGEHSDEAPCILSTDLFSYLVSAVFLLPALYAENGKQMSIKLVPSGGENERNLLQLIYIAHVVQILLTAETNDEEEMEVEEVISKEDREEGKSLAQLLSFMYKCAGLERDVKITPPRLLQMVRSATLPFLRCAAIFFHFVTNVPAPHDLCLEFPNSEGESICTYLALPSSFTQLVEEPLVNRLVSRWCDHPTARDMMSHRSRRLLDYPLEINQLVHLPSDYSELINQASLFTCPNSDGDDSRAPTMCLVCGTMLCSQSYCCQTELDGVPVGACTAHAACCGAGVGLFLRVRECQVLLLSGRTKGSFFPPPYLDDYGETDQGLRRGNPLHLNPERYRRLQTIWLVHSVPQEIAHALESNSSLLSIDWQHL